MLMNMGAAVALYSAGCFAMGRISNGLAYPVTLDFVTGFSGWLPFSGSESLIFWKKINTSDLLMTY